MAVVTKAVLKSYFNDGDVPTESEYIDLIDTMGDMSVTIYDSNDDGKVDAADDSDALGGVVAGNYLQRTSAARPGVIKLYRADSDSGYYVRHYWTGTHWYFQGYNSSDAFHAHCRVGYANDAGLFAGAAISTFHRNTGDIINGYDCRLAGGLIVGNSGVAVTNAQIWISNSSTRIYEGVGNAIRLYTNSGYIDVGPQNTSWGHIATDRAKFHFNKTIGVDGDICASSGIAVGYRDANPDDDSLEIYYGTTKMGDLTANDTTWFRINAATAKNIYTSRVFRADGGFQTYTNSRTTILETSQLDTHLYGSYVSAYMSLYLGWYGGNSTALGATRVGNRNQGYGDIHADNFQNESKRSSKRNIRSYKDVETNSLDLVKQMLPIKYKKANPNASRPNQDRIGFIAEDLIEILPEVVGIDQEGLPEGIDYGQITPLLCLAIQELTNKVEQLERGGR